MDERLKPFLTEVEKPARYIGGEYNTPDMLKACSVRFCLCFTDLYEVGMSNLGIAILYDVLNSAEGIVCERCFAPWTDMGKVLKDNKIPLSSIETGRKLKNFDIVGFSGKGQRGGISSYSGRRTRFSQSRTDNRLFRRFFHRGRGGNRPRFLPYRGKIQRRQA